MHVALVNCGTAEVRQVDGWNGTTPPQPKPPTSDIIAARVQLQLSVADSVQHVCKCK
jgi:hypothetical protein